MNGILIPGGGCSFKFDSGIGRSTNLVFQIAKRVNKFVLNIVQCSFFTYNTYNL